MLHAREHDTILLTKNGEPTRAADRWRAALNTVVAVGTPDDTLPTLERLVNGCRE